MRRVLILCLLAIGMMAEAQNQIITKKLQLNNVPAGSPNDKILVRGATDKVVKEVLKSSFTPTLQQVLSISNDPTTLPISLRDATYMCTSGSNYDYSGFNSSYFFTYDSNNPMGNYVMNLWKDRLEFSKDYYYTRYAPSELSYFYSSNRYRKLHLDNDLVSDKQIDLFLPTESGRIGLEKPYKVYTALVTQTGTNAPVSTVLENTLGGVPTWSYNGVGQYSISLPNAFTNNKTALFIQGSNDGDTSSALFFEKLYRIDASNINCIVGNGSTDGNGLLNNTTIEIRVYN